jgi:hypothetical protein
MKEELIDLSYTVELEPGEQLRLPPGLVEKVGPGRWIVTVRPLTGVTAPSPIRRHDAFLIGYAAGDEGLYDDLPG